MQIFGTHRRYMKIQKENALISWIDLLQRLTGYRPQSDMQKDDGDFIGWHRGYHDF